MNPDLIKSALISAACNAPSVHNVQPTRFLIRGETIFLIEDLTRRIPIGDPSGRDAGFSLGIAAEGLAIELSKHGLKLLDKGEDNQDFGLGENLPTRRAFAVSEGAKPDPLAQYLKSRYSHRGNFLAPTLDDYEAAKALADENLCVINDKSELAYAAKIYDDASLRCFRDNAFRAEILSWMRLNKSHPQYWRDGLNYEAMAMSPFEAMAAGIVLGAKTFPLLDKIGLGAALTAEAEKVTGSAGIILLHRPKAESFFDNGRQFYRNWLKIVAGGFQAAVMASLADDDFCQNELCKMKNIPPQNRIITAWRTGKTTDKPPARSRLGAEEIIL